MKVPMTFFDGILEIRVRWFVRFFGVIAGEGLFETFHSKR